jgi:predicted amidohydrolase YtcJ
MPASVYLLVLSVTAGIIAIILAITPPSGFQLPFLSSDKTYCYDSVRTAANDLESGGKCFSVTADGIFSRVWIVANDGSKGSEIQKGAVIPGLWDGHGHVLGYGDSLSIADLYFASSLDDSLSRLKEYSEKHPGSGSKAEWLRGSGWDQAAFGRMPTADDLETKFPGQFVMLSRVDVHCIWVSNAVLDLLPDPIPEVPGGEVIGRGVLCDTAMDMVYEHWPQPSANQTLQMISMAMKELNKVGIVGVHDAGVTPATLELYKELVETDDWTVRVYAMLECSVRNTFCPSAVEKFTRTDGYLSLRSVKLFSGKHKSMVE